MSEDIHIDMADLRVVEYLAATTFDEETLQATNSGNANHLSKLDNA